jgi:hypothetical protein
VSATSFWEVAMLAELGRPWGRSTLIAFTDDASSRVMEARFVPAETSRAYLDCQHACIERHNRPAALYSDRHSIFTKHDHEDGQPTKLQRALSSLDITGIQALTLQAKGRIVRLFQTLQDRLVKALRLAGIMTWRRPTSPCPP